MKDCKKAQGALEYMVTYGWALTLVATIIAILIFASGTNLDVNACTNFMNILCKGIKAEGNDLLLVLQNATGQRISLNPMTSFSFDGETTSVTIYYAGTEYSSGTLLIGRAEEFTIRAIGKAEARQISITFVEEGTGLERTLTSQMRAIATEEEPEGTPGIDNCLELQEINNDLAGDHYLAQDIDCDVAPFNQGSGFEPIGTFTGSLEGNGFTISGLYINRPTEDYVGLFSDIGAAGEVSNLALANVDITGSRWTGGLAGRNDGTVSQVSSTGTISGGMSTGGLLGSNSGPVTLSNSGGSVQGSSHNVGGLIGHNSGSIGRSYSTASVTGTGSSFTSAAGGLVGSNSGSATRSYSTGNVQSGGNYVGGLTGRNSNASINNCYSSSNVQTTRADSSVGGLSGYSTDTVGIVQSYSRGSVTAPPAGNTLDGGLAGSGSATCSVSFWDTQTSGQATTFCGASGKTTAEMKTASTFVGWSPSYWNLEDGSYPTLK